MKSRLRFLSRLFFALPFIIGSCMTNDSEDFPDFGEQLAKDIAAIDDYLASKNIVALEHSSGIRYVLHRVTTQKKPTIDSCATVDYKGIFMASDQQFDKNTNFSFRVKDVIDGWKIGIPLLHQGDSATFYIPSVYAYGPLGFPPEIPGNANLIFHVALHKVGSTYKQSDFTCFSKEVFRNFDEQLQYDIDEIDDYLATNNISALPHESGLRYVIHRQTTGQQPTIDSCITSNYAGVLMRENVEFDRGSNKSFPLNSLIDGWKIGVPLLHEGDSATLYIPSGLAYGYDGYLPDIPGNANLIYHVGLTKVGKTYKTSDSSCN